MGAAAQTPEQNRELIRSSELGRDSCGRRLVRSMPRLSGRSRDPDRSTRRAARTVEGSGKRSSNGPGEGGGERDHE